MYTPEKKLIQHWSEGFQFEGPDMDYDGWKKISDDFKKERERQYQETEDLYDLQEKEASEVNGMLEGTSGKDYLYLQESIVDYRDELKSLYKGKTLKETKTPEFQAKLYQIKSGLDKKRNSIQSFRDQAALADKYAMNTPSIKKDAWTNYLMEQSQLPPDQRERDLTNKLKTDSQFYNLSDDIRSELDLVKKTDYHYTRDENGQLLNYESNYSPDLGHYDAKGNFIPEVSDRFVDKMMKSKKHFYNAITSMLPPEESKRLLGSGNTKEFNDTVRKLAKQTIAAEAQYGYQPDRKLISSKMKPITTTASDRKKIDEDNEVIAIQENLQNKFSQSLDSYLGDYWKGFEYEYDDNGDVDTIIATYEDPKEKLRSRKLKTERIAVNIHDSESVRGAVINRIKKYKNKNTVSVPKPLDGENEKKGAAAIDKNKTYKLDGKSYSYSDLSKSYTDEEIAQAVKAGVLK